MRTEMALPAQRLIGSTFDWLSPVGSVLRFLCWKCCCQAGRQNQPKFRTQTRSLSSLTFLLWRVLHQSLCFSTSLSGIILGATFWSQGAFAHLDWAWIWVYVLPLWCLASLACSSALTLHRFGSRTKIKLVDKNWRLQIWLHKWK